ncbi:MAG: glycosyl transferase group 1 [Chthoniobacteraceae bacterium]|nr:glycosyl transferase group 1 [Chthoniobacteraceae bacterium]
MGCWLNHMEAKRLAFVVSHPIQYYVPLYRRLAARRDICIKVFFTWHGGVGETLDHGFQQAVAWDIPLTEGYELEVMPNRAADPGTHHFYGLRNPTLIKRILEWRPDVVHLTGYAYASHLWALWVCWHSGIPVIFRGDSHLLDGQSGLKWVLKRFLLGAIYKRTAACLYVGKANKAYYEAFGVDEARLFYCPHSIDIERFSTPHEQLEAQAAAWRVSLGIAPEQFVVLFAGKFETKKRPLELIRAILANADPNIVLVMVGDGHLGNEVRQLASSKPGRVFILPFENQSRMPVVYRLGDVFVLPSAFGETWGLAVNEALACGRPAIVSDKVGCASNLIEAGVNGAVFPADCWDEFAVELHHIQMASWAKDQLSIQRTCELFSIASTEKSLSCTVAAILHSREE